MNIEQASQYLGFSKSTLYSWAHQKRIPYVKIGGRLRFDKRKLDAWLARFEFDVVDDDYDCNIVGGD